MRLRHELLRSDCTEQGFVVAIDASHAAFVPSDWVGYIATAGVFQRPANHAPPRKQLAQLKPGFPVSCHSSTKPFFAFGRSILDAFAMRRLLRFFTGIALIGKGDFYRLAIDQLTCRVDCWIWDRSCSLTRVICIASRASIIATIIFALLPRLVL